MGPFAQGSNRRARLILQELRPGPVSPWPGRTSMETQKMTNQTVKLIRQAHKTKSPERLKWRNIELQVTNLAGAADFWCGALGLVNRGIESAGLALGTKTRTLVVLHPGATGPAGARHAGLYHVALGVPDQAEFSRLLRRLISRRVPISLVDHLMSKAIYLTDPDGLGIEIALETPERFGRFGETSEMSAGFALYDVHGNPHSGRARLDVEAELLQAPQSPVESAISDDAFLAHLHLQVGALESSITWFEGLGFRRNLVLPHLGFSDLGAGGVYTHRLALNTWAGQNIQPARPEMARLLRYTLEIADPSLLEATCDLEESENGVTGRDPVGAEVNVILPAYNCEGGSRAKSHQP